MKKNQKTYLLLAVVVGIWGFIGFKIVNVAHPEPVKTAELAANELFVPKQLKQRDTFSITANYRDPFLGTVSAIKKIKKKVTPVKKVQREIPQKMIGYTGFITDGASKQKIFFVTIEGQQHMMGLNETVQEVKLIRGSKERITVRYDAKTRTIPLSE